MRKTHDQPGSTLQSFKENLKKHLIKNWSHLDLEIKSICKIEGKQMVVLKTPYKYTITLKMHQSLWEGISFLVLNPKYIYQSRIALSEVFGYSTVEKAIDALVELSLPQLLGHAENAIELCGIIAKTSKELTFPTKKSPKDTSGDFLKL